MSTEINKSTFRVGAFTSSEIVALMSNGKKTGEVGKPFFTYVEETNMERRLQRSLTDEVFSRPTTWGNLVENHVFDLLGTSYKECSQETIVHAKYDFWAGSPDAQSFEDGGNTICDIKSPLTLKSFCQMVDCIKEGLSSIEIMNTIREAHKDGDKFYYQLVSNAIITNSKYGELIVFLPYRSELSKIRQLATQYDGFEQWKFKWIDNASDDELPWLNEGGYYKNLNKIRFEIPQEDKDKLTSRVLEASKLLIQL